MTSFFQLEVKVPINVVLSTKMSKGLILVTCRKDQKCDYCVSLHHGVQFVCTGNS